MAPFRVFVLFHAASSIYVSNENTLHQQKNSTHSKNFLGSNSKKTLHIENGKHSIEDENSAHSKKTLHIESSKHSLEDENSAHSKKTLQNGHSKHSSKHESSGQSKKIVTSTKTVKQSPQHSSQSKKKIGSKNTIPSQQHSNFLLAELAHPSRHNNEIQGREKFITMELNSSEPLSSAALIRKLQERTPIVLGQTEAKLLETEAERNNPMKSLRRIHRDAVVSRLHAHRLHGHQHRHVHDVLSDGSSLRNQTGGAKFVSDEEEAKMINLTNFNATLAKETFVEYREAAREGPWGRVLVMTISGIFFLAFGLLFVN